MPRQIVGHDHPLLLKAGANQMAQHAGMIKIAVQQKHRPFRLRRQKNVRRQAVRARIEHAPKMLAARERQAVIFPVRPERGRFRRGAIQRQFGLLALQLLKNWEHRMHGHPALARDRTGAHPDK